MQAQRTCQVFAVAVPHVKDHEGLVLWAGNEAGDLGYLYDTDPVSSSCSQETRGGPGVGPSYGSRTREPGKRGAAFALWQT